MAEAVPEVKAEPEPEPVAEAVPEKKAEPEPEPVAEAVPEVKAEPEPEPVAEAVPEPVEVAMATPAPEPQPAFTPAPTLVAQTDEVEEVEEVEEVKEVDAVPVTMESGDDSGATDEAEEVPPPPPPPAADDGYGGASGAAPGSSGYSEVEERVEIGGALKDMTWVGFQQTMESSRVFIKTNEPVRYHVTEEGDNLVVVELENTRIPLRNNHRFLDTHFFNTAVTMITPREIEGVSRNVRIEIQLRSKVPYQPGQDENMVYLDFQRP